MREIKFRIWIKDEERYYDESDEESYMIVPNGNVTYTSESYEEDGVWFTDTTSATNDVILEQYTGLKDKNGKEIYEGDIVDQFVCGVHQSKGESCGRSTIWQVRWNEEECCFELHYLYGSLFGDSMMSKGEEYVVIGNIHENPELLEERQPIKQEQRDGQANEA